MQKSRNPMDDCLRILAYFGGIAGLYVLYHLFQISGSIITSGDIRILLTASALILTVAVILVFSYIGVFLSERALLILGQYRNFKKQKPQKLESDETAERLIYLEMTLASMLEGMERRLRVLEDKVVEDRGLYEYSLYPEEEE